jgi:hypothetical protein
LADLLKQRYEETLMKDNEAKALLLKSAWEKHNKDSF